MIGWADIDIDKTVHPGSRIERLPSMLQTPAIVLRWLLTDVADRARTLGRRDPLTPPSRLQRVGSGDWSAIGEVGVHYLRGLTDLQSTDRVLDIGCGSGRTARVLTRELRSPGSYDGLDVKAEYIAWCRKHYRRTRAPFRFTHADAHNTNYNPEGRDSAADYRFPYPDDAFDLVFAFSLFTHLLPETAERYVSEATRVLAPGGRMLLTWFLLTDAPAPAPALDFRFASGAAAVTDPENPEAAVAYPEQWVRERIAANGLSLRDPIHYGSWHGRPSIHLQDMTVVDHS